MTTSSDSVVRSSSSSASPATDRCWVIPRNHRSAILGRVADFSIGRCRERHGVGVRGQCPEHGESYPVSVGAGDESKRRASPLGVRQLRPKVLLTALITVLLWASSAACSSGHEYDSAVAEMDRDIKAVTDAMSDVTEVVEIRRVLECRNDGSGPIPPASIVDLVLRGEHTLDDANGLVPRIVC